MKYAAPFFGLIFAAANASSMAYPGGYGGAWGRNRLNQTVHISELGIWAEKNSTKATSDAELLPNVPFKGECKWVGQSATTRAYALDCRSGNRSSIAGAYFKIRFSRSQYNQCGKGTTIYECTSGCQPLRVPRLFVDEPDEC